METMAERFERLMPHVQVYGPADAHPRPAILIFHGCGGIAGNMGLYAEVAAERTRLAALIDHLDVPAVSLVAQSMGGWTCLGYALRHPEQVRALVMASTTGTLDDPETKALFRAHAAGRPEQALVARGIHPACGERMAKEQPALHFLYQEVDALSHDLDKDGVRRKLIAMRTTPRVAIAALRMPVLCVSGEEDAVIPAAAVAVLASIIPGARLEAVPAAGHSVYWERPETFNRLVDAFLTARAS